MSEQAVYAAIGAVTKAMAERGIAKTRKNTQQGYSFRGIDDVYNALAPVLASCGLCVLPRILSRETTERTTAKGGVLFYVVLEVEYDLVAAADGSKHTIRVIGEAMDSADKATSKAMSAAYKYACMQAFCIPLHGEPDADAETHDVAPAHDHEAWLEAIAGADLAGLNDIAAELARTQMPVGDKAALRAAFAARKHALAEAS